MRGDTTGTARVSRVSTFGFEWEMLLRGEAFLALLMLDYNLVLVLDWPRQAGPGMRSWGWCP